MDGSANIFVDVQGSSAHSSIIIMNREASTKATALAPQVDAFKMKSGFLGSTSLMPGSEGISRKPSVMRDGTRDDRRNLRHLTRKVSTNEQKKRVFSADDDENNSTSIVNRSKGNIMRQSAAGFSGKVMPISYDLDDDAGESPINLMQTPIKPFKALPAWVNDLISANWIAWIGVVGIIVLSIQNIVVTAQE